MLFTHKYGDIEALNEKCTEANQTESDTIQINCYDAIGAWCSFFLSRQHLKHSAKSIDSRCPI